MATGTGGGLIIIDKNANVWLRTAASTTLNDVITPHYSALIYWDKHLVMGNGEALSTYPDLVYADWTATTEENHISGDASVPIELPKQYRTQKFDFGYPGCQKQLRSITIGYKDDASWDTEYFTIGYRAEDTVDSDSVPDFTTLQTITLGVDTRAYVKNLNAPSVAATYFQFQFDTEELCNYTTKASHIRILFMHIYYMVLSRKEE